LGLNWNIDGSDDQKQEKLFFYMTNMGVLPSELVFNNTIANGEWNNGLKVQELAGKAIPDLPNIWLILKNYRFWCKNALIS